MSNQNSHAFEVTNKSVFAIALPTTLAYMSVPLLGLVDTGVVGNMGDAALLGGLAVGAILFDVIFTTFNFVRSSTTGLVAQAVGRGDEEGQRSVLVRSLIVSAVLGFLMLLAAPLILGAGLWAMDVPPAVEQGTIAYFSIRVLSAPLTLVNFSILGWLLGRAQAGLGLLLQTILNGTNIVLSLLFGLYFGWGLEGVAWATVIGEATAVLFGIAIVWRSYKGSGPLSWPRVLNKEALYRLLAVNQDIMIRSFVLMFAFAFFAAEGAKFGETTLAANAVLMNFFLVGCYFLDGLATAVEQLVGRSIGAKYRPAFDTSVKLTLYWGYVMAIFAGIIFYAAGPTIIEILTNNQAVRDETHVYLIWAIITPLIGVMAFQMDGVFIGATWSEDMRNMMLLSLVAYLVVWWFAVPLWGNHGLWLALEVFLGFRGATLYARVPKRAKQAFG